VNTFILVTQELQRVLFKILEEDELSGYKPRYPQPVKPAQSTPEDQLITEILFPTAT
jgi:hypothetical protein